MMKYNEIIETCFFNPEHAGFDEAEFHRILEYFPANSSSRMVFAMREAKAEFPISLRFKASGNPYILAAAEWICRQCTKKKYIQLMEMSPKDWHILLGIPMSQKRTALQITEACDRLVQTIKKGEPYERKC